MSHTPFGDRLREVRSLAGISARELDRLAEITEGHSSLIEAGIVKNVTAETAASVARVFGADLNWLITGVGKVPSTRAVRNSLEEARAQRVKRESAKSRTGTEG